MTGLAPFRPPTAERWGVWDHYLETLPDSGFRQSSWWTALASEAFALMVRRDGVILGGGVVSLHRSGGDRGYYLIPDGPLLPTHPAEQREVLRALFTTIRERRRHEMVTVTHLRIAPRWERVPEHLGDLLPGAPMHGLAIGPRQLVRVDLRVSETSLLARMMPAARSHIALARRFGLGITEDHSDQGVEDLLDLMRVARKRDPEWPQFEEELRVTIPHLLAHHQGSLTFAEDGGDRLAGTMVVQCGARATCLAAGALQEGRQLIAPTLLQFEMMRRAKAHGAAWYEAPVNGISLQLGGAPVTFVPPLDLIFDRA